MLFLDARRRQLYQYVNAPFSVRFAPLTKASTINSFGSLPISSKTARAASAFVLPPSIIFFPTAIAFVMADLSDEVEVCGVVITGEIVVVALLFICTFQRYETRISASVCGMISSPGIFSNSINAQSVNRWRSTSNPVVSRIIVTIAVVCS